MTDEELAAYREGQRLLAAGMSNEELAGFLERDIWSSVSLAELECLDTSGFPKEYGALFEAARRLRVNPQVLGQD